MCSGSVYQIQKITCKLRSSILALKVDNLRSYSSAENKGVAFVPFSYFKVWVARNASIASLFVESSLTCKKNYWNLKMVKSQKIFLNIVLSSKNSWLNRKIFHPILTTQNTSSNSQFVLEMRFFPSKVVGHFFALRDARSRNLTIKVTLIDRRY